MKTTLNALITLILLTVLPSLASAQEMVKPFGSAVEMAKIDADSYSLTLTVGEEIELDAEFLKRVWIDETRLVHARVDDDGRLFLKGCKEGKAAVRLIWNAEADEDIEGTVRTADGVPKAMLIVTVKAAQS